MNKQLLRNKREKKGYTQEQIARLLDITLQHYQNIESLKKTTIPNFILGCKLCFILDIKPFELANLRDLFPLE